MSFPGFKDRIEEGDGVILYLSFNAMQYLEVVPWKRNRKSGENVEHVHQTTYGALKVMDLVGKRYGSKVELTKGYAYVLRPTPELWTKCLPHRTQILYATDISMILLQLELKPGSIVIESGTGSGSLSHSFVRTVMNGGNGNVGHLYTFDFHAQRVEQAREEFRAHGLAEFVTCEQRDVCQDGFGLTDKADAVFLDLPHPWETIPHAKTALKSGPGGRICSFSPCLEQVQKASQKMRDEGFIEIVTMEVLLREFQVRKITLPVYEASRKRKLDDVDHEEEEENSKISFPEKSFVTGVPLTTMPGHTGFLTFATLPPTITYDL